MAKKPVGENGPLHIQFGPNPALNWNKIKYPENKEAQESLIAGAFAKQQSAGTPYQLTQLPQDDFDFKFERNGNVSHLELMEMTFPGKKRGTPYADNEQKIQSEKFSNTIIEGIRRKRYAKASSPTILRLLLHSLAVYAK